MTTERIRLAVGAADYLAQAGILRALESAEEMEVVAVCSTLDSLREASRSLLPDVVLTTLRLAPDYTDEGVVFAGELRESRPDVGVVVLGDLADAQVALRLFDGGISRRVYLLRERIRAANELTRAVHDVADGSSMVDPAAVGALLAAAARRDGSRPTATLTSREQEVFALLAHAESNRAIGEELGISTRAVERHINSIFRKLGLIDSENVNRRVKAALVFVGKEV
jgi:DNA-binding NarL/FixJ family response regulator